MINDKAEVYGLSSDLFTLLFTSTGLRAQTLDTGKLYRSTWKESQISHIIQESIQQYIDENRNVDIFYRPTFHLQECVW